MRLLNIKWLVVAVSVYVIEGVVAVAIFFQVTRYRALSGPYQVRSDVVPLVLSACRLKGLGQGVTPIHTSSRLTGGTGSLPSVMPVM